MSTTDVTEKVATSAVDDEHCSIERCVCGKTYHSWEQTMSIYPDSPKAMPCCGAKLYFSVATRIYQVQT